MQALGSLPEEDSGVVTADGVRPTLTVRVVAGGRVVEHRDVADALSAAGLTGVPRWLPTAGPRWLYSLLTAAVLMSGRYLIEGPRTVLRAWGALFMLTEGVYYAGAPAQLAWNRSRLMPAHLSTGIAEVRVAHR